MQNNKLLHSGILGMKWGKRRYQNEDGTLTDAGKKRYDRDQRENNGKKKGNKVGAADPERWVKEDIERSVRTSNAVGGLVKKTSEISKSFDPKLKKITMDLSKMSDQELREQINRNFLEKQYNELFGQVQQPKINKGKQFLDKTLSIAGTALTLGSSALGIALAIKELKG